MAPFLRLFKEKWGLFLEEKNLWDNSLKNTNLSWIFSKQKDSTDRDKPRSWSKKSQTKKKETEIRKMSMLRNWKINFGKTNHKSKRKSDNSKKTWNWRKGWRMRKIYLFQPKCKFMLFWAGLKLINYNEKFRHFDQPRLTSQKKHFPRRNFEHLFDSYHHSRSFSWIL